MTLQKAALIVAIALATAAPLFAVAPPSRRMQALDDAQASLSRLAAQTKGTPQHRLLQEQQQIQGLIDDIQSGRTVDPTAIDRALNDAQRQGAW